MIVSLIIGRKGSQGFPGKNLTPVLGKPLAWYPMKTATQVDEINKVFLSTDDEELINIAKNLNIEIIHRPNYLSNNTALGEDAFVHGYKEILKKRLGKIELLILMFCNTATINAKRISEGIYLLRENPLADSAVTVSCYNMWSPLRARRLNKEGLLDPFVPFETFGNPSELNCDRDSQGNVYYADMGCSIVRPKCLDNIENGLLPQKWMGNKIMPIHQEAGFDVDYPWQIPILEWWLNQYWYT